MGVNTSCHAGEKAPVAQPNILNFMVLMPDGFCQGLRLADSLENHAYPGAVDAPEHEYG